MCIRDSQSTGDSSRAGDVALDSVGERAGLGVRFCQRILRRRVPLLDETADQLEEVFRIDEIGLRADQSLAEAQHADVRTAAVVRLADGALAERRVLLADLGLPFGVARR